MAKTLCPMLLARGHDEATCSWCQLNGAYHALFDVKDRADPGSDVFVHLYQAITKVTEVMRDLGISVPERFDRARTT